ncbi:MAG: Phosphoglucosamine mutase [Chlamydiae bacterium]|nr:Phosphoglucosamine mutase [Chlamydiota bacterium]
MTQLFGTDGVRGRANSYPMNVETTLALGRAFGIWLKRDSSERTRVVVGKDTRLSCYIFENALIAGLCSMGIDTLMVGPLPTPGVAFITRAYRADAGIVISASHNSYRDNGIKFFSAEGYKFPDSLEKTIEDLVKAKNFEKHLPPDSQIGKNSKIDDANGRYIEFAKATLPRRFSFKGIRVVLDCANGAAFRVAPLTFKELDAEVFAESNTPNGININERCGTLHLESLQKSVLERRADVGIAFDGDADRVIMVDEKANIVDGDVILAICAYDLKQKGELQNNTVVGTVMSNFGFIKSMNDLGIEVIQSKVGDRYVIQDMLEHRSNLGGEQSGHLIFLDHNTTGDGLVSALQVLRIMKERGKSLSELASIMTRYPQVILNIKVSSKPEIDEIPGLNGAIQNIEKNLQDKGRVLVRYSGTENVCRIMLEGPNTTFCQKYACSLGDIIKAQIGM